MMGLKPFRILPSDEAEWARWCTAQSILDKTAAEAVTGVWTFDNFKRGTGSPETSVIGNVGDVYIRTDGGTSTTLYVKEDGTGKYGWIAK